MRDPSALRRHRRRAATTGAAAPLPASARVVVLPGLLQGCGEQQFSRSVHKPLLAAAQGYGLPGRARCFVLYFVASGGVCRPLASGDRTLFDDAVKHARKKESNFYNIFFCERQAR